MQNLRSVLIFALGMVVFQVITYFFAGLLAQNVFGASVFYPPSPDALCFLRCQGSAYVQGLIIPARSCGDCFSPSSSSRSGRRSGVLGRFAAGS